MPPGVKRGNLENLPVAGLVSLVGRLLDHVEALEAENASLRERLCAPDLVPGTAYEGTAGGG